MNKYQGKVAGMLISSTVTIISPRIRVSGHRLKDTVLLSVGYTSVKLEEYHSAGGTQMGPRCKSGVRS